MNINQKLSLISTADLELIKVQNQRLDEKLTALMERSLEESYIESKRIPELLNISTKTWQTWRDCINR